MKNKALPERQLEVMRTLWGSAKALTAMEVVVASGLAVNTVQACLRSLVKKEYIKQGEIVYSGTVLTRTYLPVVSKEDYLKMACETLMQVDTRHLIMDVFVREISDIAVLEELEKMILQRRKELE